jgi:hypothetical protein
MQQEILDRIKVNFPNHEPSAIIEKLISMYEKATVWEKKLINKKLGINE